MSFLTLLELVGVRDKEEQEKGTEIIVNVFFVRV